MASLANAEELKTNNGWTQDQVNQYNQKLQALQQFRSYSYHHILLAANTSVAADYLFASTTGSASSSSPISRWLHPSYTEKYKPIPINGSGSDQGSYMVLINGLTDAEFLIDSIEWEAIFVPDAGESNPHASFVEGTMRIKEPMGVNFLNLLKTTCDNLKTDPVGLTFILKTIFVGYSDSINGTEQVKQVLDVNPFTFTMTDITAEFTTVGSEYEVTFVGQCNGIGRMPAFGQIQQSGLTPAGTVGTALQNLQQKLNDAAKESYQQLIAQLDESNNTKQATSPKGRMVQYEINVDDVFRDMALDNVNGRLSQTQSDANLANPQGIDIESGITDIMLCSSAVVKRMNDHIKEGYKQVFKIESALKSDLNGVTVIINVRDCQVPVLVKDNTNNAGEIINPKIDDRPVIQFEYIYTGQNEDIIEYDMKMMLGMAFFQTYGTTNVLPSGFSSGSGNTETLAGGPGTTLNTQNANIRDLTPIPMSAQVQDPNSKNKPAAADTANFRMFMARWAFVESVATKVKIAGIPVLLDGFNLTVDQIENRSIPPQAQSLPLVQIHVRMPNDTASFRAGDSPYASDFWYTGKFMILSVKNSFTDGRFEQELELIAIPYEELVNPTDTSASPASPSSPAPQTQNQTNPPSSNDANKKPPAVTPEQKAKHGDLPPTLPPDVEFNCQTMLQQTFKTVNDCKKVRLTQSFTLDQFIRRDINVTNDPHILTNICKVANELEKLKAWMGLEVIITSGYRSPAFNKSVKGASTTSDHMKGLAVDVQFVGMKPQDAWQKLKSSPFKFRQCIWEHFGNSSWVHCAFDVDPTYPRQNTPVFFTLPH